MIEQDNDLPIIHVLMADEIPSILAMRVADSIETYGQPMRPLDGSDPARKAIWAGVDSLAYARQAQWEMEAMRLALSRSLPYIEKSDCLNCNNCNLDTCSKQALIELINRFTSVG